jgi:hypothetical protein
VSSYSSTVVSGSSAATNTPGVLPSNNTPSSSGLSSSSKKIIGGVVGGIGGAVLLAGIAFAAWRASNRNKYNPEDDLDYTAGTGQGLGSSGAAKEGLASDEAHADRYTSNVRPNAAANF